MTDPFGNGPFVSTLAAALSRTAGRS